MLSLSMSSGRTMPATISSRISKLTRISCLPSITRLPFGSTCVTTAATLVCSSSLRSTEPLPSLERVGVGGEDAARQPASLSERQLRLGRRSCRRRSPRRSCGCAGLVVERRLVGDLDLDGEDVADLVRALVLEEGARAVAPQRVRIVGGRLRRRHRHLHRLVAGLRGRVLDRRQRRLLADVARAGRARRSRRAARRRAGDGRRADERQDAIASMMTLTGRCRRRCRCGRSRARGCGDARRDAR